MFKDSKDEMIVMLKRKTQEYEEQIRVLGKQIDDMRKGETGAEQKIAALNEMHASKIKMLLKSIQNLKKEIQKEKTNQKDNARIRIIEGLKKDHEDFELAINALRKVINNEDKCDQAIKNELQKGPKRIRVATREELKMEIKSFKNQALLLLQILKKNGIQQPAGLRLDAEAGTGLRQDNRADIFDINKMDGGSAIGQEEKENEDLNIEGGGIETQELMEIKERLEESVVKLNLELREKNEKLLELLEDLEEMKVQVYARDRSVALQQKQIEDLLEELRDAKSVENDVKILVGKKIAIEEENIRLRKELDSKYLNAHDKQYEQSELELQKKSLEDNVRQLQKQLQDSQTTIMTERKTQESEKAKLRAENEQTKQELAASKKELLDLKKAQDDAQQKLQTIDGQSKGLLQTKDQDLSAFRTKVIDLENEIKEKYGKIAELEAKVIELQTELADKDYEIEFYSNSIEELQNELETLKQGDGIIVKGSQASIASPMEVNAEIEAWKMKCKTLQLNEIKLQEEIEALKAQKLVEDRERTVNNMIARNRERSKSRTKEQQIAENDGIE